jgi:enoyl-CoA hydratase/carnithine racemase
MLKLDKDGAVARLMIDRPERHNAMNLAMWRALPVLLAQAVADEDVRAIVLTSATPGLFCAGADIGEMLAARDDLDLRMATQAAINAAQAALAQCTKPLIAMVDGDAIGGGCGLILPAISDWPRRAPVSALRPRGWAWPIRCMTPRCWSIWSGRGKRGG